MCRQMVFDPNPLANLNIYSEYQYSTYLSAVSEDNQYAFVTARNGGLFVISLQNKLLPTIINRIFSSQAHCVFVQNGILYIGDVQDGLHIYDIKDIMNPILLAKWNAYSQIQSVILTKDSKYAFALGNGIVFLLDVTNPGNPNLISKNGVVAPDSYRVKFSPDETHLCISNHIKGVQIIDVRTRQNMIIRANTNPAFITWDCIFTPDQSSIYLVDAYYGLFYAYVKPIFDMPIGSTDLYTLSFKSIYSTPEIQQSIAITSDGLFLILGLRSVGQVLFQIQNNNYQDLVFVQRLNGNYLSNDIYFSQNNNEAFAFVTNGFSLLIFQQVQINTNKDFPNLFNTFQSSLLQTSPDYFPWQILCLSNGKQIIQTTPKHGFKIIDISNKYYPNLLSSTPERNGSFGGIQIDDTLNYLFVGSSQNGLEVYDISNQANPQFLNNYFPLDPKKYQNQGIGVSTDKSNQILIMSNGFYGFGIFNISNPQAIVNIGAYLNTKFSCSFEKCVITSDLHTIICACREEGLLFFDFNSQKIELVYFLQKLGSEYMILSDDERYSFVCNGFQGILIMNIENKTQPVLLSQQPLDGWAQSVISIFNQSYLLATQIEKGELVIINIEDLENPYIQSKLQFPDENSNSVCLTPDQKSAYFIGNKGLRQIPTSVNLIIHTQLQLQQTDKSGNSYFKDLSIGQSLLVGQTAQIFFIPLYIQVQVNIRNVFYYRNFQIQTLPNWITYIPQYNQLLIQVDKSGTFNNFSNEKKGENILILECLIQLNAQNFVTQNIKASVSQQIFSTLINQGYIDNQGFLTSKLDPKIDFYLDFFDDGSFSQSNVGTPKQIQQIQNDIKQILVFSQIQYPIRFFIQSSLKFNYNLKNFNETSLIQSPSLQISVLIQIVSKNGQFVKKELDGVLASFSDDKSSVKISGQTFYVNEVVSNNIQIANKTSDLSQCIIDFIISDSNNYDISKSIPLSQLSFISIYQPIIVDQSKLLQKQINNQFSNGNLYVEQTFQFSFDLNTFIQKDNLPITHQAFLVEQGDKQSQITTGLWIEFDSQNLGFSGYRSIKSLFDSYKIIVIATDGYSTVQDEFSIQFKQIPFFYVVQLAFQIIGPLLGILGIWRFRAEIYRFILQDKYQYSSDQATVGKVFKKQIVLMNQIWGDAKRLWKIYLQKNKKFEQELILQFTKNKKIDIALIIACIYQIYLDDKDKYPQINQREFEFLDSKLSRIFKRFCYQVILKQDKSTQQALKLLKRIGKKINSDNDWYKSFVDIQYKFKISQNKVVSLDQDSIKISSTDDSPIQQQKNDEIKICQIDTDMNKMNFKIEQKTNFNSFNQIQETEENKRRLSEIKIIQNINQKIQQQAHQLMDMESFGSKIQNQASNTVQTSNHHLQISSIHSKVEEQREEQYQQNFEKEKSETQNDYLNPFPEIKLKKELIIQTLTTSKPNLKWDQILLNEIILLEACGIPENNPNRISPTRGESIYLSSHQLLRVEAFKKDSEYSCCYSLAKFFKAHYSPIGLIQNNPLPKWLNCQLIDDVIYLWGTPQDNEEPEILIRVIDQFHFTIMSFFIFIKDQDGVFLNDKQQQGNLNKFKRENNKAISIRILKQQKKSSSPIHSTDNKYCLSQQQLKNTSSFRRLNKFGQDAQTDQMIKKEKIQKINSICLDKIQEIIPHQSQDYSHILDFKKQFIDSSALTYNKIPKSVNIQMNQNDMKDSFVDIEFYKQNIDQESIVNQITCNHIEEKPVQTYYYQIYQQFFNLILNRKMRDIIK
ncbi:MFS transporter, putative (macronuclear) [Tetrahymena thermophila SB210]|uniref:MFS transporter, putative n=1 Tax=Tetrahymena thermophila (strain SB210) TaxID=312017 RepID=I7MI27_TETTS|nr:MFS transporter, putative [Tetrahymena thermophila SB210]EAR90813.2 MFS transporter, putative [Tetrahymena thermophila SB210]|eukprot:XP_001011058.2 MFS transporter, putative [Tetrahymena thermophila SB210]